ncbi:hypothetical protein B0H11DRAFT_2341413 [Mycena galericulata]|nr:hypothetical protein B0H11DRAFT_2341413 [Mycena galericulata]
MTALLPMVNGSISSEPLVGGNESILRSSHRSSLSDCYVKTKGKAVGREEDSKKEKEYILDSPYTEFYPIRFNSGESRRLHGDFGQSRTYSRRNHSTHAGGPTRSGRHNFGKTFGQGLAGPPGAPLGAASGFVGGIATVLNPNDTQTPPNIVTLPPYAEKAKAGAEFNFHDIEEALGVGQIPEEVAKMFAKAFGDVVDVSNESSS